MYRDVNPSKRSSGSMACMGHIAALVLLKLFINGDEKCHTTVGTLLKYLGNIQSIIPEDQKIRKTLCCSLGRLFIAAIQALYAS